MSIPHLNVSYLFMLSFKSCCFVFGNSVRNFNKTKKQLKEYAGQSHHRDNHAQLQKGLIPVLVDDDLQVSVLSFCSKQTIQNLPEQTLSNLIAFCRITYLWFSFAERFVKVGKLLLPNGRHLVNKTCACRLRINSIWESHTCMHVRSRDYYYYYY